MDNSQKSKDRTVPSKIQFGVDELIFEEGDKGSGIGNVR